MGARLKFKKISNRCYEVSNKKDEVICFIELVRTGRFMHYCQTVPFTLMEECVERSEGLIFSPGCQDEIRKKCKELNEDAFQKAIVIRDSQNINNAKSEVKG